MSGSNKYNQKFSKLYNRTKNSFTHAEGGRSVGTAYSCTETKGHKVLKNLSQSRERSEIQYEERVLEFPGEGAVKSVPSGQLPSPVAVTLTSSRTATTLSRHRERVEVSRLAKCAFTLAEVLITLGVIGVVAAVTMPTLVTNIQERINKEKVRTVKYKLTQATDKMKALDKIGNYDSTKDFVEELKKHLSIAKICDSSHLNECWPSEKIYTVDGEQNVSGITTGSAMTALAVGSKNRTTMGIVTGDGVPMILVYAKNCAPLDSAKSYTWSVVDGKPETNASTNCISAIFDINGAKGPNRIGQDVRTLNSLYGYKLFTAQSMKYDDCENRKHDLGINECCLDCKNNHSDLDYYAGAVKACHDIGLHLPSPQTLANMAGAIYGRTDIDTYTMVMKNGYEYQGRIYDDCNEFPWGAYRLSMGNVICVDGSSIPTDGDTPLPTNLRSGYFWSSSEASADTALERGIYSIYSNWSIGGRWGERIPLCVGD